MCHGEVENIRHVLGMLGSRVPLVTSMVVIYLLLWHIMKCNNMVVIGGHLQSGCGWGAVSLFTEQIILLLYVSSRGT